MPLRFKTKRKIFKKKDNLPLRKKVCRFCQDKNRIINYKEVKTLESFIRDRGKIIPTRVTGNCAKHQRRVSAAIKQARFIALLPYLR